MFERFSDSIEIKLLKEEGKKIKSKLSTKYFYKSKSSTAQK
jgi:hypothetical protein